MARLRTFLCRNIAGAVLTAAVTLFLVMATFLGNLALTVREIQAQIGPEPHVLVDAAQTKSDHDAVVSLSAMMPAIQADLAEVKRDVKDVLKAVK